MPHLPCALIWSTMDLARPVQARKPFGAWMLDAREYSFLQNGSPWPTASLSKLFATGGQLHTTGCRSELAISIKLAAPPLFPVRLTVSWSETANAGFTAGCLRAKLLCVSCRLLFQFFSWALCSGCKHFHVFVCSAGCFEFYLHFFLLCTLQHEDTVRFLTITDVLVVESSSGGAVALFGQRNNAGHLLHLQQPVTWERKTRLPYFYEKSSYQLRQ